MKHDHTCPRCACKKLYVIDEAKIPNYEFANSVEPLTLFAHYGFYGKKGLLGGTKQERVGVTVEAWVCSGCGFSELYARDLEQLERFAADGLVRVVGG